MWENIFLDWLLKYMDYNVWVYLNQICINMDGVNWRWECDVIKLLTNELIFGWFQIVKKLEWVYYKIFKNIFYLFFCYIEIIFDF